MLQVRIRFAVSSRASIMLAFGAFLSCALPFGGVHAQNDSISMWDAAEFRSWTFVPYWTSQSQLNSFSADGVYKHVSDVIYFSGVQPKEDGSLHYLSAASGHLTALKNHAAQHGFRFHMSMFDVPKNPDEESADAVERVWNSITSNAATRTTFVNNVKNLLAANNMTGINLDWERPNTVAEWANYSQLAKDLQVALPASAEVSVDDYGFADSRWDDSTAFDARSYDQLFIMGYHYPAFSGDSLNNNSFANMKLNLTGQGADKAFKNEQLVLGIGTWGMRVGGGTLKSMKDIAGANPNLPYNAGSYSDGTSTWTIESREQVRAKVQLALDRSMAGVMFWTLHFDATNKLSLHRVAHHYTAFKRDIPDLNLDGKVDAADAIALSENMGSVPGWTGANTATRFDDFYMSSNWELGDRDGNGFVNQQDADWLSGRFAALGVNLPDRLVYSGTLENYHDSQGLSDRWYVPRDAANRLPETGNFTQHGAGHLSFTGAGLGADKHSGAAVTLRNQNSPEAFDSLNTAPRVMEVELAAPIDLSQDEEAYFTFLVRQNTGPLLAAQQTSSNRTLALEFLNDNGVNQLDFSFHGLQQQFGINSRADEAGEDMAAGGFGENNVYLFVGKIAGNGDGANTMHASIFADGATVENFTRPGFEWMLDAEGSQGFDPTIAQLRWQSLFEANYTVSNVWLGGASSFFTALPSALGDFNDDDDVDAGDYTVWRDTFGQSVTAGTGADGDGDGMIDDGDYAIWKSNFGAVVGSGSGVTGSASAAVPEPTALAFFAIGWCLVVVQFARRMDKPVSLQESTDRIVRSTAPVRSADQLAALQTVPLPGVSSS